MKKSINLVFGFLILTLLVSCQKELSQETGQPAPPTGGNGGTAVFTLQGSGSTCMNSVVTGTYGQGTALTAAEKVNIQVNVTTPGTWSITTPTVTGVLFTGSGTFTAPGVQTVTLQGSGTPTAGGTQTFTVAAGSASCTFTVVVAGSGSSGCGTAQGTYTMGTALTAANKVTVQHTFATAGTYSVKATAASSGFSFGPVSTVVTATTAGTSLTIDLPGTGTPTTAGANAFVIDFGDGKTCSFSVNVVGTTPPPTNTDYFPLTDASWWSYGDQAGTDTFKTTNVSSVVLGGKTYRRLISADAGGPFDTSEYRKDPATGFYYFYQSTAELVDAGLVVTFSSPGLDVLFLKNSLATLDSFDSDHPAMVGTLPVTVRFHSVVVNGNASVVVNGKTFNNVYQIRATVLVGFGGNFQQVSNTPLDYFYAKGIGLIRVTDGVGSDNIRYWQVN